MKSKVKIYNICTLIINMLKYRNNKYILNDINECKKIINDNKNEHINIIGEGDKGIAYNISSTKCGSIVMKKFKTSEEKNGMFTEIFLLQQVKKLIDDYICPNFVYYYLHNDTYILMEHADGNLEDFLSTVHEKKIYKSMFFQICVGILCLQKYLKTFHNDLSPGNILFKKISENIIFMYNINGVKYYVPTYGYLFVISDFERSQSILLNNTINISQHIDNNDDFNKLRGLHHILIYACIHKLYSNYIDLKLLIKDKINKSKFDNYVKYTKSYHKIVLYMIKHNMFEWENIIDNVTKENIAYLRKYKNNIMTKTPIDFTFGKYFKKYINSTNIDNNDVINFKIDF